MKTLKHFLLKCEKVSLYHLQLEYHLFKIHYVTRKIKWIIQIINSKKKCKRNLNIKIVGPKGPKTPTHFISSPRPTPKRRKCPMTNEGNPDCQDTLPRTTQSLVDQNHRRGRRHIAKCNPLEDPKGDPEPNGSAIGA